MLQENSPIANNLLPNILPNKNILASSRVKAFEDDNFNVTQSIKFVFCKV